MSDNKDDGGSAFPELTSSFEEGINREPGYLKEISSVGGMTLRDYFAAHVMDRAILMSKSGGKIDYEYDLKLAAKIAYTMADAMLKARSGT